MKANPRILVIDDEKRICDNVEKILSKGGFEVIKALSAKEALEKMAREAFSLLISDIVMPETNGLELLRLVKEQWPLSKVIMITAYASIDTAVKAVRMGALDYLPKPFTPDELRSTVHKALIGELIEAPTTQEERKSIDIIDIDIPFDKKDVAKYAGEAYADMLGPSDMPVVAVPSAESLPNYCLVGERSCDIFGKLGKTCKVGLKTAECPQKKAKQKKAGKKGKGFDGEKLIGIDQPFEYEAVASIAGPEYVRNLRHEGVVFVPYEELKVSVAKLLEKAPKDKPVPIALMEEPATKNILVIDDEVSVNNNIRKILVRKGYHVDQAVSKDEAIRAVQKRAYKLVLLDLKMPGVSGLELLKAIRDQQPKTMVIIITGYASIETAVETARMGAFDYLAKPFTPDELRNVTDNAFRMAA